MEKSNIPQKMQYLWVTTYIMAGVGEKYKIGQKNGPRYFVIPPIIWAHNVATPPFGVTIVGILLSNYIFLQFFLMKIGQLSNACNLLILSRGNDKHNNSVNILCCQLANFCQFWSKIDDSWDLCKSYEKILVGGLGLF